MSVVDAQRAFERQLTFYRKPRLAKLAAAPLRMASSALRLGWCRASGKPLAIQARTFWGQRMHVMFPEPGSIALAHYGFLEEGLTSLLMRLLKPGMTFFDVGGHYGYFSLLGAELVGKTGHVHAFEPSPHTWTVLSENTAGISNIRLNNIALYSQNGELTLQDFGVEFSEFNSLTAGRLDEKTRRRLRPKQIKVRAQTMDKYVIDNNAHPDFVKIDAEGAELQILCGMVETMRSAKPMITIEVAPDPADTPGASVKSLQFLEDQGYVPQEWSAGQIRPHVRKSSYTYDNLLFIHRERTA